MTADAGGRSAAFRALHHAGSPLLLPNAWDHGSAAILIDAGFAAIGTTSLGVAAAVGLPDGDGRTRDSTLAVATCLARLPCLLSVDIEAGFSDDPAGVADLVAHLEGLGVAGVNLEDGRSDGTLAPTGWQGELISTVKARAPGVFLNARTDGYWLAATAAGAPAPDRADTVARLRRYVHAGADGVFVPGLAADADIRAVASAVDAPLNVLYLPGRHTITHLAGLGVRRISLGSLLLRAALHAVRVTAGEIRADRYTQPEGIPGYRDINELASGAARYLDPAL